MCLNPTLIFNKILKLKIIRMYCNQTQLTQLEPFGYWEWKGICPVYSVHICESDQLGEPKGGHFCFSENLKVEIFVFKKWGTKEVM